MKNYQKFKEDTIVETTIHTLEIPLGAKGIVSYEPTNDEQLVDVYINDYLYNLPQHSLKVAKNYTKKQRKEIYLEVAYIISEDIKSNNFVCNLIGNIIQSGGGEIEKFVNEKTFPEFLLFREKSNFYGAWLSHYYMWSILGHEDIDEKRKNEIINEGKMTILLLCAEMCN